MCYQAVIAQNAAMDYRYQTKTLVRDIEKDRKGFLKYKINKRRFEKSAGPQINQHRRFSDKEGVKALSVFHSSFTWKVWTQVSTCLEHRQTSLNCLLT